MTDRAPDQRRTSTPTQVHPKNKTPARKKPAAKHRDTLEHKVQRWNNHMSEKRKHVDSFPEKLPSSSSTGRNKTKSKKRKITQTKPDDTPLEAQAIAIANKQSRKELKEDDVDYVASDPDTQGGDLLRDANKRTEKKIPFTTNIKSMDEFYKDNPAEDVSPSQNQKEVSEPEEIFHGLGVDNLSTIVDDNMTWWAQTNRRETTGTLHKKEVVSYHHIAKLLWIPEDTPMPFKPCKNVLSGCCKAQIEPKLQHPLARGKACMAYYSPKEYLARVKGVAPDNISLNHNELCEFCYRFYAGTAIARIRRNKHQVQQEIPSRYYVVGVPGEYSVEGMVQPIEHNNTQHVDGVLGNMRTFNVSDFVPVVGHLDADNITISRVLSIEDYNKLSGKLSTDQKKRYIFGWKEIGPLHHLNDNAFFEGRQIDSYDKIFSTTESEITHADTIRNHLKERNNTIHPVVMLAFEDLTKCIDNEDIQTEAKQVSETNTLLGRNLKLCLHAYDNAPPYEEHKIYYTTLVIINVCQLIISGELTLSISELGKDKIRSYIQQYDKILALMIEEKIMSDDELNNTKVYDADVGWEVPLIFANYPTFQRRYNMLDFQYAKLLNYSIQRPKPLTYLQSVYLNSETPISEREIDETITNTWSNLISNSNTTSGLSTISLTNLINRAKRSFGYITSRLLDFYDIQWPSFPTIHTGNAIQVYEQIKQIFVNLINYHKAETVEYNSLLKHLPNVLCDFSQTLEYLKSLPLDTLNTLVTSMDGFSNIYASENHSSVASKLFEQDAGKNITKYYALVSCLFRVYVVERLRMLEPVEKKTIRYNLLLFRNAHLQLYRKIFEDPNNILSDEDLDEPITPASRHSLSIIQYYWPSSDREIHQGLLPNFVDSLANVGFISDGGLDRLKWVKQQFKKPDRACSGRGEGDLQKEFCNDSEPAYVYTCLELQLSLQGLYEHSTVVPSFSTAVQIDTWFDNTHQETVRNYLMSLIDNYPKMIADATSESLCYMLEYNPALKEVLVETYRDWFSWRVIANMDIVRRCYDKTRSFQEAYRITYERIKLHSNKTIYRNVETDFAEFMCIALKNSRKFFIGKNIAVKEEDKLTQKDILLIDYVIRATNPSATFYACDLEIIGITKSSLASLQKMNTIFMNHIEKSTGIRSNTEQNIVMLLDHDQLGEQRTSSSAEGRGHAKRQTHSPQIAALVKALEPKQYRLLNFFFSYLTKYQNVRIMEIQNQDIVEQQIKQLCKHYETEKVEDLPDLATNFLFGLCCNSVKTLFAQQLNARSRGNDEVYHDITNDTFVCGKPKHKNSTKRKKDTHGVMARGSIGLSPNDVLNTAPPVIHNTKAEVLEPKCGNISIIEINAVGSIITMGTSKMPKVMRKTSNKKNKKPNLQLHVRKPPYWITPCCGNADSYNFYGWYPNGYACGVCSDAKNDSAALKSYFCQNPSCQVATTRFQMVTVYDNISNKGIRRILLCVRCMRYWDHSGVDRKVPWLMTTLQKGCQSPTIIAQINDS